MCIGSVTIMEVADICDYFCGNEGEILAPSRIELQLSDQYCHSTDCVS